MSGKTESSKTRSNLIGAGLHLFGKNGYEGTSTRELAGRAKTNIASITYHFGGKAGLRAACATEVADRVSEALDATGALQPPDSAEAAVAQIEKLVVAFVNLIVGMPQAADMVAFILRELTGPGEITDMLYTSVVEPRHRALCILWATATGRREDDAAVKLAAFAMIGQIVYFRIAMPFVEKRMDWETIGPAETSGIVETILTNLRATIERQRI